MCGLEIMALGTRCCKGFVVQHKTNDNTTIEIEHEILFKTCI